MTELMRIPDTVHEQATRLSKKKDMSLGEAVRYMCRNGEWDV